ncbi:DUF4153 domain-containing protein [Ruegeria meonggei]|uniref:Uncharacterized protein n=1 Tax=Ruegeria meonggei TaxID=1446476 RepID=A0A1X6YMQ1_9RHOB|nr:DUF4173 domain-containing protein [Ruegeria meonggei]SLN24082.1 hypothetical protein RUM8411_00944 [Ruegeria meonggei]
MPKKLVIRGLPHSLARDGWWLASESGYQVGQSPPVRPPEAAREDDKWVPLLGALALLVLMGDQLFWGHKPGLSLAIFAWCIFAAANLDASDRRRTLPAAGILLLMTLPVLEHVQLLSLSFLVLGLFGAVAMLHLPDTVGVRATGPWLAAATLRLMGRLPTAGLLDCAAQMRIWRNRHRLSDQTSQSSVRAFIRNWAFPLGGVLVLSTLLISANPVLEHMLIRMLHVDIDVFTLVWRCLLWVGLGLLIWPFLSATAPSSAVNLSVPSWDSSRVLNAGSVFRALVLFNLMLALQSVMDISILSGRAALPEGMSHATYAHRGAYPLLATALLAGTFALAARPFLNQNPALKPLLLLWLTQNVLLTLSAAFRLNLYIGAFGLTYLRVYALIWMGLVALGLAMVTWQVLRERSSGWLVLRIAALGVGTLYVCTFVNFAALIATDTLSRAAHSGKTDRTDWVYVCSLGHTAATAIVAQTKRQPLLHIPGWAFDCVHPEPTQLNWREWDFRTARVNGYLATNTYSEAQ